MTVETAQRPEREEVSLHHVLHEIGHGVMLVGDNLSLRYANRTARSELRSAAVLGVVEGNVAATHPEQQRILVKAFEDAQAGRRSMIELGIERQAAMYGLMPLNNAQGESSGSVLILCSRRESLEPLTLTLFSKAVGLTASEQAVLTGLCEGLGAPEIAVLQEVCVSTVRTHICSIRTKTGSRSVRQVISKIAALPPMAIRLP